MAKIKRKEVLKAQGRWGDAIVDIGLAYTTGLDFVGRAKKSIKNLYDYQQGTVLFKPTKCKDRQFRLTVEGALSYFVGDDYVELGFKEDKGFAIAPYVAVQFMNAEIILETQRAIAMGNYIFTTADGTGTKVEYTFGYRKRGKDLLIDVHHSSFPYNGR